MNKITAVTIICDVIGSRNLTEQLNYEASINKIIENLNEKFKDNITPFVLRNGDEIFGVCSKFSEGYKAFKEIYFLSKRNNIPLYIGIGYGSILKQSIGSTQIQGSSIWNAADALKIIKEDKSDFRHLLGLNKDYKFFVKNTVDDFPESFLNYQFYFILEKIMKRTEKQQLVIDYVEKHHGLTHEEIGQRLGYSNNQSTNISKTLSRAEYHLVRGAEESLMELLDKYQTKMQKD